VDVAVRPEFRWWLLTLLLVGILLLISALALDRPDVVWEAGVARCPHCRAEVEPYSRRCRTCREQYDWSVAPDAQSPFSAWSLSALEAEDLQARKTLLGREEAEARVARVLSVSPEAARLYVDHVGRGLCGWCGGTGKDLDDAPRFLKPCPACLGRGACVGCGGDRRVRVGDEASHLALLAYEAGLHDVSDDLPVDVQRAEVRRLAEAFLERHAGTLEATRIVFWPLWQPASGGESGTDRPRAAGGPCVVEAARARIDAVLQALRGD
jgi:predicted amidophosphoribosyltransferase